MSCKCSLCLDCLEGLFSEELVEATGLSETFNDILFGAMEENLVQCSPSDIYFYTWRWVNPDEQNKETEASRMQPYIDLGPIGHFKGTLRSEAEIAHCKKILRVFNFAP